MPPLRNAEAEARTALERHRVVQEQVAADIARTRDALAAATARHAQARRDLHHAERVKADSDAATARLTTEDAALRAEEAGSAERIAAAETERVASRDAMREAEAAANAATDRAAQLTASSQALAQALAGAESRARRLAGQIGQLRGERDRAAMGQVDGARVAEAAALADRMEAEAPASACRAGCGRARPGGGGGRGHGGAAAGRCGECRPRQADGRDDRAGRGAGREGRRTLAAHGGRVDGAARLGGGARRRAGRGAGRVRRPDGGAALARTARPARRGAAGEPGWPDLVAGPAALTRALSGIGLVEDDAAGDAGQAGAGGRANAGVPHRGGVALGRLHHPPAARRRPRRCACSSATG